MGRDFHRRNALTEAALKNARQYDITVTGRQLRDLTLRVTPARANAPLWSLALPQPEGTHAMTTVVKRSARAILLDGDELVLIKRTKPGRDPYWVTVGGGVEADDKSIEAALHREVFEELGGTLERAELVHLITDSLDGGIGIQHIFAARLVSMDLTERTGTEFGKPERGAYEVVRVPFTPAAVGELNLMPPQLAQFIAVSTGAILSVPRHAGPRPVMSAAEWDFVSLNGPDNAGKASQLRLLAHSSRSARSMTTTIGRVSG